VFSHVEADETGSLNNWLKEYPRATVVCNKVANINLEDFLLRPARILNEGETLDLGRRHLRLINTPHFPHGWDAHMWYETTQDVLFSSDLYCHGGESLPIVEHDISQPIIDFYSKGAFIPYGRSTNEAMTKLAEFNPRTLAPMHGSVIKGEVCKVIFEKVRADLQARI
jgi:flavorubredoxin